MSSIKQYHHHYHLSYPQLLIEVNLPRPRHGEDNDFSEFAAKIKKIFSD